MVDFEYSFRVIEDAMMGCVRSAPPWRKRPRSLRRSAARSSATPLGLDPDWCDRREAGDAVVSLDDLARLWAAGATLAEIEQSTGVSRGVAIGRIHRARKAGDPRFEPRARKTPLSRSTKCLPTPSTSPIPSFGNPTASAPQAAAGASCPRRHREA